MQHMFDASEPGIIIFRTENFDAKETSKFQILSYKIITHLKRKLRACTMRIYQEKMKISAQKLFFQIFFNFFIALYLSTNGETNFILYEEISCCLIHWQSPISFDHLVCIMWGVRMEGVPCIFGVGLFRILFKRNTLICSPLSYQWTLLLTRYDYAATI